MGDEIRPSDMARLKKADSIMSSLDVEDPFNQKGPVITYETLADDLYNEPYTEEKTMALAIEAQGVSCQIVDYLIDRVIDIVEEKRLNRLMPLNISNFLVDISKSVLDSEFIDVNIEFEDDPIGEIEPPAVSLDPWARGRILNSNMEDLMLNPEEDEEDKEKDKERMIRKRQLEIYRAKKEAKEEIERWKKGANDFLKGVNFDKETEPIPLREITERPSTEEQKMRAIKHQQTLKEKKKLKEEKKKLMNLKRERKLALGSVKGSYTFNYNGVIMPVKKSDMTKAPSLRQLVPTDYMRENEVLPEEESKNVVKKIEDIDPQNYKLPGFYNPRAENNKKTNIVKSNPFELADLNPGVIMTIGGRNKGNLATTKTLREDGKVRYSRQDYLKMVEDRGMRNLALSMNITDPTRAVKVKKKYKDKKRKEKKATEKSEFDRSDKSMNKSKGELMRGSSTGMVVKSSALLNDLRVKEPLRFPKKNYSELISKRADQKRKMKKKQPNMNQLDNFNVQLMKGKGPDKRGGVNRPGLRPSHSDAFLLRKKALERSKRYPRERTFNHLSQSRLERIKLTPINSKGIFDK